MSSGEKMENQGFKVQDRRRFAPDGTPLSAEGEGSRPDPQNAGEIPQAPESGARAEAPEPGEVEASFAGLILSLAAGAQSGLGIAPHPITGKVSVNLAEAKQSIDLLGILEEKTRGNLSPEEEQLILTFLYDLRLRYVEKKGKP